jgi:predicted DNA-binding WGR domain protein
MNKKWCLLKISDGSRGAQGKQKVYEITVDGTTVTCEWGMAEKATRARSVHKFYSSQAAVAFAEEKRWSKMARGYRVAYAV